MISDSRIQLQFDVDKPVDLVDLTLAFQAFNRQYAKFVNSYLSEKDVEIPDEDAEKMKTVGDAIKYIEEKAGA